MNRPYDPGRGDGWDVHPAAADPVADEPDLQPGVDTVLRDDALLDALGRGELPAHYRADVTARLITNWRDDLEEPGIAGRPALTLAPSAGAHSQPQRSQSPGPEPGDLPAPDQLARPPELDATDPGPTRVARHAADEDETVDLPRYSDETVDLPAYPDTGDRIEEPFRTAFVAAGYARPAVSGRSGDPRDEPTQQLGAALVGLSGRADGDPPTGRVGPVRRHVRRRRLDRIVVAAAAAAAILAAGSAGSVAAASTARPGDPLWGISKVIYADRAQSIEASEEAHAALTKARAAAARGDARSARRYLAEAKQKAHEVRRDSDEGDLLKHDMATMNALADSLSPSPDGSADDGAPGAQNPTDLQRQAAPRQRHSGSKGVPSSGTNPRPAPAPGNPRPTKAAPSAKPTEGATATATEPEPTETTEPTTEPSATESTEPEPPTTDSEASAAQ